MIQPKRPLQLKKRFITNIQEAAMAVAAMENIALAQEQLRLNVAAQWCIGPKLTLHSATDVVQVIMVMRVEENAGTQQRKKSHIHTTI